MTRPEHPNATLVRELFAAFRTADLATILATIPEDALWRFPGRRGALAGEHRGRDAILAFLLKVRELTAGTFHLELDDVVANDDCAVALFTGHGERNGKTLRNPTCLRMRIRDGRVVDVSEFVWDLYDVDEFWSGSSEGMIEARARTLEVNDATYVAWNAHDPDAVADVFDENAVVREVGLQESVGRDAVRARAVALLTAFPDLRLERLALVIDGDRHADRWRLSGTHRGELFGLAATGRSVSIEGATFTRLGANGLVIEDVHLSDLAGLMAQLSG